MGWSGGAHPTPGLGGRGRYCAWRRQAVHGELRAHQGCSSTSDLLPAWLSDPRGRVIQPVICSRADSGSASLGEAETALLSSSQGVLRLLLAWGPHFASPPSK